MSNRLAVLAAEVRAAHQQVLEAASSAVTAARTAGSALMEAKDSVPHGSWLPWLREVGIAPRTAQEYMQLARLDEANTLRVAHLGIGLALRLIAQKLEKSAAPAAARPLCVRKANFWPELSSRQRAS
jgi:hypothetical protein